MQIYCVTPVRNSARDRTRLVGQHGGGGVGEEHGTPFGWSQALCVHLGVDVRTVTRDRFGGGTCSSGSCSWNCGRHGAWGLVSHLACRCQVNQLEIIYAYVYIEASAQTVHSIFSGISYSIVIALKNGDWKFGYKSGKRQARATYREWNPPLSRLGCGRV